MSSRELDEREVRAAQAIEAVLLFGAFVFRVQLLVAAVALLVGIGAAFGPTFNGFHAAFRAAVGSRLSPPTETVPTTAARALDALAVVVLLIALAGFALGIDGVAWVLTLIVAVVATVEATTGYNAALAVLERARRNH